MKLQPWREAVIITSSLPSARKGNLSKTCTVDGWPPSSMDSYIMDCGYNPNNTVDENSVSMGTCCILNPELCLNEISLLSNVERVVAGGFLQCRQSGLHHWSQCVTHLSDNRHHHTVSFPVRSYIKMLLNVTFWTFPPSSRAIKPSVSHFTPSPLHFIDVL